MTSSSSTLRTGQAVELQGTALALERPLQGLSSATSRSSSAFFSFPSSTPPAEDGGRIDSLGSTRRQPFHLRVQAFDQRERHQPGLFYLDSLIDHRADFELLVMRKVDTRPPSRSTGPARGWFVSPVTLPATTGMPSPRSLPSIDYSATTTITVRTSLSTWLHRPARRPRRREPKTHPSRPHAPSERPSHSCTRRPPWPPGTLYDALEAYLLPLGDDVIKTTRQLYAFRRIKLRMRRDPPADEEAPCYLKPTRQHHPGARFSHDVTKIGHFGTGNLEVSISSAQDFERAQPLDWPAIKRANG